MTRLTVAFPSVSMLFGLHHPHCYASALTALPLSSNRYSSTLQASHLVILDSTYVWGPLSNGRRR